MRVILLVRAAGPCTVAGGLFNILEPALKGMLQKSGYTDIRVAPIPSARWSAGKG